MLLAIYRKAIEEKLGNDFIEFVFKEITIRNIPPREYLQLIK
ncbi:sporulation histidine kinase inhibitor Sda [Bacillus litorisediminis]